MRSPATWHGHRLRLRLPGVGARQRRLAVGVTLAGAALLTAACGAPSPVAAGSGAGGTGVTVSGLTQASTSSPAGRGTGATVSGQPVAATRQPTTTPPPTTTTVPPPVPLPTPAPLQPFLSSTSISQGQWQAAGRTVGGIPAVYQTYLLPPDDPTGAVAGVAWMDTKLLSAMLYSGSSSPGGGPWRYTAPIGPNVAQSLVAAFNGGFIMNVAEGGYYAEGKTVYPLRDGIASFVIYADGTSTVGLWGRDVTMTPQVIAVRQNLPLLVDGGAPVAAAADTAAWGATLGGVTYTWRSGLGVTADGALVYVAGPGLNAADLAALLVRAGVIRGMELDINPEWPTFATYNPPPGSPASGANGTDLLTGMAGSPYRFFTPSWARDFVAMTARAGA